MGKWIHRLTNKNPENKTADCAYCGVGVRIMLHNGVWKCKVGKMTWNKKKRNWIYLAHKKDHCEKCGFKPVIKEQLDVDHINGDPLNSELDNLMTLCANCHRLKTFRPDLF